MIVNADVRGLEVFVTADLSEDAVLRKELLTPGYDMHSDNQKVFKLPERVYAKIFVFKLLFGASAYGYALDPDFTHISSSHKYWQKVIDAFYEKYKGIAKWHGNLVDIVRQQGFIEGPSGRIYVYKPEMRNGELKWPITTIKNYVVQGTGADLVMLARIEAWKQFQALGIEGHFIGTVHDSLVYDVPDEHVDVTARLLFDSIAAIPRLCQERFGYTFKLPITSEIQVGKSKGTLEEYKLC